MLRLQYSNQVIKPGISIGNVQWRTRIEGLTFYLDPQQSLTKEQENRQCFRSISFHYLLRLLSTPALYILQCLPGHTTEGKPGKKVPNGTEGGKNSKAPVLNEVRNIPLCLQTYKITAPCKIEKPNPLHTPNFVLSSLKEKERSFTQLLSNTQELEID